MGSEILKQSHDPNNHLQGFNLKTNSYTYKYGPTLVFNISMSSSSM